MTPDRPAQAPQRKPCVALMGEFSAGKSTLANLLLEQDRSPVRVTATQVPPVWYSQGPPAAQRMARDGAATPLPPDDWSSARPEETRMISVTLEADILRACDLIDMPGTSDPNMVPDFWQDFLPQVDVVVWCTPANQAWRQSEAALWEQVPPHLWTRSLLLVTRMDGLQSERDRDRVLARVRAEAGALFRAVLPISLTEALCHRDDEAALETCGAADMVRFLCHALEGTSVPPERHVRHAPEAVTAPPPQTPPVRTDAAPETGRIVPRRITRKTGGAGRAARR